MFGFTTTDRDIEVSALKSRDKDIQDLLEDKALMQKNFARAKEEAEYTYKRDIERLRDTHNDSLKANRVSTEEARIAYEEKEVALIAKHNAELTRLERESENKIATLELKVTRIEDAYKAQFEEASRQYAEQVKNLQAEANARVELEKKKVEAEKVKIIADAKLEALTLQECAQAEWLKYYEDKIDEIGNMYSTIIETLTDIIGERTDIDVVDLIKNLPQPIAKANATSTSTKK